MTKINVEAIRNVYLYSEIIGKIKVPSKEIQKHPSDYVVVFADSGDYEIITVKELKTVFPKAIIVNHKHYITIPKMTYQLEIPIDSSLGKLVYTDTDRALFDIIETNGYDFIPQELRDKHCIIWARKVMDFADTLEEAKSIAKTDFDYLPTKIYSPPPK